MATSASASPATWARVIFSLRTALARITVTNGARPTNGTTMAALAPTPMDAMNAILPVPPRTPVTKAYAPPLSGQYAEADAEFKRMIEREPLNAKAHFDLAVCAFHLHRPDEAIRELQATLALEPWYTRAEELLATIYLQKKDYDQARMRLQYLILVDTTNYTAHAKLR